MVAHPGGYRWSSWGAHALGRADPLVADHPIYRALGRTAEERQAAYRALFEPPPDDAFLDAVRRATNGGWALGDERFAKAIAAALGRRAAPLPRGRPPKPTPEPGQGNLL